MSKKRYPFIRELGVAFNSGQTNIVTLTGNIRDLFHWKPEKKKGYYLSLLELLDSVWSKIKSRIIIKYDSQGKLQIKKNDIAALQLAWIRWECNLLGKRTEIEDAVGESSSRVRRAENRFNQLRTDANRDPSSAIYFLEKLCECSRTRIKGEPVLDQNLLIILDEADLRFPDSDSARMTHMDRNLLGQTQEWFSSPHFVANKDMVIMVADSMSQINHRLVGLPQVMNIEVDFPDENARLNYIHWFNSHQPDKGKIQLWGTQNQLAKLSGGLSLHALRQLLKGATHEEKKITPTDVVASIEAYIKQQLGEDVVEFKKPTHYLKDIFGAEYLKKFLKEVYIPRLKASDGRAISSSIVCGPIGSGKTYIFEAAAAEAGMVVIVLKNIRSSLFGGTDILIEKLRRILNSLSKVLIIVDEADTQFGGVSGEVHATEKRLTGKIQAMMSDPAMKGRVSWLLMTARVELLSPDIRRPGRGGDFIIPVFDPVGEDAKDMIRWMVKPVFNRKVSEADMEKLFRVCEGFSASVYSSIRSELLAQANGKTLSAEEIELIVDDIVPADIAETRHYQKLQALVNCTRKSLIPEHLYSPETDFKVSRKNWFKEIKEMEAQGIGC